MIEIRKLDQNYYLFIDGESIINVKRNKNGRYQIKAKDFNLGDEISKYSLEDFPELSSLNISTRNAFRLNKEIKGILFNYTQDGYRINLNFRPNLFLWKKPYSFGDYYKSISTIILKQFDYKYEIGIGKHNTNNSFSYTFKVEKLEDSIENIINFYLDVIQEIDVKADHLLLSKQLNSIVTLFTFPKKIKVSCEQYILYFAQFLQDLGIRATSNLKEEAGKVLFSVVPTDETQALDKIREALAVYLKLPESPIVYDDSFKSMRLRQQIENLQHSQRMAARELQFSEKLLAAQSDLLHEKNITISQQQSVIENQQKIIEKIIDPAIMMNSVEKKEELEELYDGIKVGESESLKKWLGISLNPAKAIKTAVKNTFGKEEKNSVLGLDEES